MDTIKAFLAKYSITTHGFAVAFLTASAAYAAVPQFHALVTSIYNAFPAKMQELVATGLALYAWYRKGQPAVN